MPNANLTYESAVTKTYPASAGTGLTLRDQSEITKIVVRADDASGVDAAMGVGFGASAASEEILVAGTRPGEWMVLGTAAAVEGVVATIPTAGHVSLVDWTHGRAAFRISGAAASKSLEKICSIDWADNMTPNGAVFSASVAGTGCDIIRNDSGGVASYLILCDRSFGQYLFDAILDSGEEFDIAVL